MTYFDSLRRAGTVRVACFMVLGSSLLGACAPSVAPPTETGSGAEVTAATSPESRPFLSFLSRDTSVDPVAPALTADDDTATAESPADTGPSMSDAEIAAAGRTPDAQGGEVSEPSTRPRPFGFLFKRTPGDVPLVHETAEAMPSPESEPGVEVTTAAFETGPVDAPRSTGLFGRRSAVGDDAESDPVRGVVAGLPFGEVVTVCGLSRKDMGTEVARSATYRLYDTNPTSTAPRPQFIAGFKDNCARQFTASLAMFGASDVHEATRYNPLNTNPYSETDKAYETVKVRLCGVARGKPCPPSKARRLARNSAFVSVYRGFGDNGEWLEMFLHDGKLNAFETRTN